MPPQPQPGSRISNVEWGLLIGAAATLDFLQFLLDLIAIGFILNPIIDVCVGGALPIYFKMRGVKMDSKKVITWLAGPIWEIVTDGLLPFGWVVDIIVTMIFDKIDKRLPKLPI